MATSPPLRERQEAVRRAEVRRIQQHVATPGYRSLGMGGPNVVGYVEDATGGEDGWWRVGYLEDGVSHQRLGVWYQVTDKRRYRLVPEERRRDPEWSRFRWEWNGSATSSDDISHALKEHAQRPLHRRRHSR